LAFASAIPNFFIASQSSYNQSITSNYHNQLSNLYPSIMPPKNSFNSGSNASTNTGGAKSAMTQDDASRIQGGQVSFPSLPLHTLFTIYFTAWC
jgi:hypothetical protein